MFSRDLSPNKQCNVHGCRAWVVFDMLRAGSVISLILYWQASFIRQGHRLMHHAVQIVTAFSAWLFADPAMAVFVAIVLLAVMIIIGRYWANVRPGLPRPVPTAAAVVARLVRRSTGGETF